MHRVETYAWCAALLGAALSAGCSLPRGVTNPSGSGMDASAMGNDSGTRNDAWSNVDAFVVPGEDAYVPGNDAYVAPNDAYVAPNDAYVPPADDAYVPPSDAGPPDCTATFMPTSTNFQLCSFDSTSSCTFYLQLGSGTNCDDVCGRTGHTCIAAIDNNPTNHCTSSGGSQMCNHNMSDAICTCSWP